ncbi:glycosyltransferase [Sulfurimonas sp. SAG-AH-194-I05]|nr:glycosyltransferase [Sulfurimonas sp. SAG-AH-194-I05]MDF1874467.1 glycosyltransferase [Sulfurimonas sp. SAG-AH-194-I05]
MRNLKKLLYITDQEEYSEHGTIGPLFHGYLHEYLNVEIVYFTKYKNSFQKKNTNYIVPIQYRKHVCSYLSLKDVDLTSYDFVFVRNKLDALADVLKLRTMYGYKVGYRVSFPKTQEAYEAVKANKSNNLFKMLGSLYNGYKIKKLLKQCDLFMPTSKDMQDTFYGGSDVKSFPLPAGLDPQRITPHRESDGDLCNFIYVGTLDTLHDFQKILVSFSMLKSQKWHLHIATKDLEYARSIVGGYSSISNQITPFMADNLDVLMQKVDDSDVGIALLPDIPVYNTTIPAKIMDYYTCALPTLLTDNRKNRTLFDDTDALFCRFDTKEIAEKLEYILGMSQEEIANMGHAGQDKLLHHKRNYKLMAQKLFAQLESL